MVDYQQSHKHLNAISLHAGPNIDTNEGKENPTADAVMW